MSARMNPDSPVVAVVAVVATAGLAITSFLLSYAGLGAAAEWANVPSWLAWAVPVTIDGSILVYTLAALVFRARGESAHLAWTALGVFAGLSVIANGVHAWNDAPAALQTGLGIVVAGLAPVAVLLTTHTIARLVIAPPAADAAPIVDDARDVVFESTPLAEHLAAQREGVRELAASVAPSDPVDVDERNERIRKLRDRRWSLSRIADEVGVSKSTVSRVLNPPATDAAVDDVDERPTLVAV